MFWIMLPVKDRIITLARSCGLKKMDFPIGSPALAGVTIPS
jgi:hypothetical protein